jgi:hypothetical protein
MESITNETYALDYNSMMDLLQTGPRKNKLATAKKNCRKFEKEYRAIFDPKNISREKWLSEGWVYGGNGAGPIWEKKSIADKINTLKTLMVYCCANTPSGKHARPRSDMKEIYEKYKQMKIDLEAPLKEKVIAGEKTEYQEKNWEDKPELKKRMELKFQPKNEPEDPLEKLRWWRDRVIMRLYTDLPPRRLEPCSCLITYKKDGDKEKNWLWIEKNMYPTFIWNKFKNCESVIKENKGKAPTISTKAMGRKVLGTYLEHLSNFFPDQSLEGKHLFYSITKAGLEIMSPAAFSDLVGRIFSTKDKVIKPTLLRHIHNTHTFPDFKGKWNELVENAKMMGHSVTIARHYLRPKKKSN